MNAKQLTILGVVLVVLVAAVAVQRVRLRQEIVRDETQSLNIRVDTGGVDRVTITKGIAEPPAVELTRADAAWSLPSVWHAKADGERIKRLLTRLTELAGEARGNSETLFDDFGITDAKAIHLALYQNNAERLHLLIGTAQVGWDQFFARRAGSPAVFLCRSNLLSSELGIFGNIESAAVKAESWVDYHLISAAPEAVHHLELREGSGDWRALDGPPPQSLLNLRATQVVDPQGAGYGLESPGWQLRVMKKEGAPLELAVGGAVAGTAETRYVKITTEPPLMVRNGAVPFPSPPPAGFAIYAVSSSLLDQLKTELAQPKPPAPDAHPKS